MPECIVCQKDIPQDEIEEIKDRRMCSQCWSDFRYGVYADSYYKDFKKVDEEYNYIGMYPHYKRNY
jgi:hypothetical protein